MGIIKQMPDRLQNMIAAGEVIDKAASVIKELVENSIDAKATKIDIYIENFGLSKIRVVDNGIGMNEVDAKQAFLRHATSKLFSETDLNHINTLGFRGEALAAIASVSKVMLRTKQKNEKGHFVKLEGGSIIDSGLTSVNDGTDISIESLFYNTPARFKHLKAERTEKNYIIQTFEGLALSMPSISFSLTFDGELYKQTFGNNDMYSLIDNILGRNISKNMTLISDTFQKIGIKGYLMSPEYTRSNRNNIYIFVNNRLIKNYSFLQSVVEGYHSLLMVNRYPIALIYLEIDPVLLDYNVHPQKHEIKFVNERLLTYHLSNVIKDKLESRKDGIRAVSISKEDEGVFIEETYSRQSFDDLFIEDERVVEKDSKTSFPTLYYVGQLLGTYLLFQNENGLYLMDQHAAEERVRYEYYRKVFGNPLKGVKNMIIPLPLTLSSAYLDKLDTYINVLEENEFYFNEKNEVIKTPIWIKDDHIEIAIEAIIDQMEEKDKVDLSYLRDKLAADVSCKASIKANHKLNILEINKLVEDLSKSDNPYSCPHGRPTVILLTNYEIEKLFRRVV